MKKIMFLIVVAAGMLLSATNANAQSGWKTLGTVAGDTVIASSGLDTVSKIVPLTAGYSSVNFKVEYTKISGTVSLKAYIYPGDGTDWDAVTDSTAAFSNSTSFVYIPKTGTSPYSHYKIQVRPATGAATTQSVKVVVKYLPKRYDH